MQRSHNPVPRHARMNRAIMTLAAALTAQLRL